MVYTNQLANVVLAPAISSFFFPYTEEVMVKAEDNGCNRPEMLGKPHATD